MVTLTEEGFKSSYNLDEMLAEDALWLVKQARKDKNEFLKMASQIQLGQKEWDLFWKQLRLQKLNCK
jgi:hypothetical protein